MNSELKSGEAEHSPLPWFPIRGYHGVNAVAITSKRGKTFVIARTSSARVGREQDDANAALIVRAVNSHAALVAALEAIFYCVNGIHESHRNATETAVIDRARAAIAKAKGWP